MPSDVPTLSRAQVREVDRRAIEDYGLPGIVLMENAARNAARVVRRAIPTGGKVAIVCGRGNNGGDGFAIARHLSNVGMRVELFIACDARSILGDAETQYRVARHMAIPCHSFDTQDDIAITASLLSNVDCIVDAILGTGFHGEVRAPLDAAIAAINAAGRPVIAIDVPSGLDCDTGQPSNATVRASMTVTFVARKRGFDAPGAADYTGEVIVVDIGAPRRILQDVLEATGSG